MNLTRRVSGHMRLEGGAVVTYNVLLDGAVVGTALININKRTVPWSETVSYQIGERTFTSLAAFKAAVAETHGGKP
jgi:hypothetical protein